MPMSNTSASRVARAAPAEALASDYLEVKQRRDNYVEAATRNAENELELHREFHRAVVVYYLDLKAYSEFDQIKNRWRTAKALRPALARPYHPDGVTDAEAAQIRGHDQQPTAVKLGGDYVDLGRMRASEQDTDGHEYVQGLDHIADYINKKEQVWVRAAGPNDKALQRTQAPVLIGADDLIRLSDTLNNIAQKIGVSAIQDNSKNRPKGQIRNESA